MSLRTIHVLRSKISSCSRYFLLLIASISSVVQSTVDINDSRSYETWTRLLVWSTENQYETQRIKLFSLY